MPSEKKHGARVAPSGANSQLWLAPTLRDPLAATISLPGSKSVTNRALVLAALADSPSTLYKPSTLAIAN